MNVEKSKAKAGYQQPNSYNGNNMKYMSKRIFIFNYSLNTFRFSHHITTTAITTTIFQQKIIPDWLIFWYARHLFRLMRSYAFSHSLIINLLYKMLTIIFRMLKKDLAEIIRIESSSFRFGKNISDWDNEYLIVLYLLYKSI